MLARTVSWQARRDYQQETKDDAEQLLRQQEIGSKQFGLDRKREAMEAQIVVLRSEYEAEESEALKVIGIEKARNERFAQTSKNVEESKSWCVYKNNRTSQENKIQGTNSEHQTWKIEHRPAKRTAG